MNIVENEFMFEQKYRPQFLEDCILPELDKKTFSGMIKAGRLGHTLLVSKSPGTGKTTLAKVLCNEIDAEVLFMNGSDCKIDVIRDKLTKFASTMTTRKGGKVIIIDEFDRKQLAEAQRHMRAFMEAYSSNCSVLITANNIEGIIEPIRSRCTIVEFGKSTEDDKKRMMIEMIRRLMKICEIENVEIDGDEGKKSIAALVKKQFPDFRSCITTLNRFAKTGKIDSGMLALNSATTEDLNELVIAMRGKKFSTFRQLVPNLITDYETFIKMFYDRMFNELDKESIPMMIDVIGRNQSTYQNVANLEIHVTWMLTELMLSVGWK